MNTADFYNKYNYPSPPRNLRSIIDGHVFGPIGAVDCNILVMGCGTIEANCVAFNNRSSDVIGIDLSRNSLAVSKSIRRNFKQQNLSLIVEDACEYGDDEQFDYVLANCCIHHTDHERALRNAARVIRPHGSFYGIVYSDNRPDYLREFRDQFLKAGFDAAEAAAVLSIERPEFYEIFDKNLTEIADTWLNPYFRDFNYIELFHLLSDNDFFVKKMFYCGPMNDRIAFVAEKN